MKTYPLMMLMLASTLCCAGCAKSSYPPQASGADKSVSSSMPKQGSYCTVQFRRDYLGASRELPVGPTTTSVNGAKASVAGRFLRSDEEWIVLAAEDDYEFWIPRSVILMLKVNVPHNSRQGH